MAKKGRCRINLSVCALAGREGLSWTKKVSSKRKIVGPAIEAHSIKLCQRG
nr:MAG TPA: hypothetical protein [Caudoviricetes sp.]